MAHLTIRSEPQYRRDAFERGLRTVGYTVTPRAQPTSPEDLLVLWNRKPVDEAAASAWESKGGSVLVCENGYIGKDAQGRPYFAIAVHGHNGSGWFPVGSEDRFAKLGVDLKPWRAPKPFSHVLVCGQRGIGSPGMASPANWEYSAKRTLQRHTMRPIKLRPHPGRAQVTRGPAPGPLEQDLECAWACAIWSSSAGVKALVLGVPVLFDAPRWVAEEAACRLNDVDMPVCDDERRRRAMHRVAHGQWSTEEIERGEPFARIREQIGGAKW